LLSRKIEFARLYHLMTNRATAQLRYIAISATDGFADGSLVWIGSVETLDKAHKLIQIACRRIRNPQSHDSKGDAGQG
jgi:hypothetical protein